MRTDEGHGPGKLLGKVTVTVELYEGNTTVLLVGRKVVGPRPHVRPSPELVALIEAYAREVIVESVEGKSDAG